MNLSKLKKVFSGFDHYKGGYFFKRNEHILFGYVVEKRGFGYVVWDFKYPLYDLREAPNLLYSTILEKSRFTLTGDKEKDTDTTKLLEAYLVDLVASQSHEYSVLDFCDDLKNSKQRIEHPNISFSFGVGMLLSDKFDEAEQYLKSSLSSLDDVYAKRCSELLHLMKSEPRKIKMYIKNLEDNMLKIINR